MDPKRTGGRIGALGRLDQLGGLGWCFELGLGNRPDQSGVGQGKIGGDK